MRQAKRFCIESAELIENFEKAVADTTRIWEIHHKNEIVTLDDGTVQIHSRKELIDTGRYYNRPASELIFLTRSDHRKLHTNGDKNPMFGRTGPNSPMFCKHGSKHPGWKGDSAGVSAIYHRALKLFKRGLISEEEFQTYRDKRAEFRRLKIAK